ncbi:hypothetical protein GCM10008090_27690 [Arenicella chitinivorans]|uniref:Uncharacterized protein n=2 Tax=Arenicella chitinivorans TaxID=1329800 RepID=A0A918RYT7_9GAMM|nr:hypothetical protein GCM10008090_27690 [Arenicella chitinivorans]
MLTFVLLVTTSCTSSDRDFFESAYGEPSDQINVIAYQTEGSDNLFKSEYAWLLDVSADSDWANRVSSTEFSIGEKSDNGFHVAKHLISKFPHAFIADSTIRLYFVAEVERRSHYILRTEQGDSAIYYVSTI